MALTTAFVNAVRRQGSIPTTLSSADILAIGDEEIQGRFIPLLESLRQNYFVREMTVSPDARGRVALPMRAIGAGLRSVQIALGSGWVSLPLRDLAEADYVGGGASPEAYAVDGGSIILLPTGSAGSLRIRYAARPGKMVLDTDPLLARAITSVVAGPTTTAITCAFTGSASMSDIISAGPAHQHKAIAANPTGVQPSFVFLNSELIEQPIAGDYMAGFDTSPFVPLPEELFAALVHATAADILLSYGYLEEAGAQEKQADKITDRARLYLLPRNEGNPQTVKGGLRRALGGRGNWRR